MSDNIELKHDDQQMSDKMSVKSWIQRGVICDGSSLSNTYKNPSVTHKKRKYNYENKAVNTRGMSSKWYDQPHRIAVGL